MTCRLIAVFAVLTLVTTGAMAETETQSVLPANLTPEARKNREMWLNETAGENLAFGKETVFSTRPDYRLTQDDNDRLDLTDGKLSSRKDDHIWFDRAAVGWQQTPANLMIDLGEVQPVGKVVVRFLGGAAQNGLRFPRRLELVVSEDGKTFYRAATLSKLMLGEKDRGGEPGVFLLPEEGQAYVYPLALGDLRTKARFIGLQINADIGFVFADELAVLKGDFAADEITLRDEDRTPFVISGLAFAPLKPMLAISTNVHTPNYFRLTDARQPEDKKKPITFVIELPRPATILKEHSTGTITEEAVIKNGKPYRRYTISEPSARRDKIGTFYLHAGDAASLDGTKATFYALSDGYEPNRIDVPIQPVMIPRVGKLTDLHVSLAWMSLNHALNWPNFLDDWEHLGFNAVATFPRYWKGEVSPDKAALLAEARRRGMKVIYNESPFHMMEHRRKREAEIYSQLPDKPSTNLCPSYRGPFYQEEIKRVGDLYELVRPDFVFYDIECWYNGASEAGRCARCREKMTESGQEFDSFLTKQGTEMIRDMGRQIEARATALGVPVPHIATYNNHAARPIYHKVFDFNKLYPSLLVSAQPSLYVKGDATIVHRTIRDNYQALGSRNIIPWLSTGTYGEHEPYKVEAMVLESVLNGASGITYYCFSDFDTPMDFYYHAKALAHIAPYQKLLTDGRPTELKTDNEALFVSGYRHGGELLVLVGNYQNTPRTKARITLPFSGTAEIRDVRKNTALPAGSVLEVNVPAQQIALIYVRAAK